MQRNLFTFETTHHALWAEEVAREAGIAVEVVPAPPAARARCHLALETGAGDVTRLAATLDAALVPHRQYREGAGGA